MGRWRIFMYKLLSLAFLLFLPMLCVFSPAFGASSPRIEVGDQSFPAQQVTPLPAPTPTVQPARSRTWLEPSARPIRLAWFYKPPENGRADLLPGQYDAFVLTKNDEQTRDLLRSMGVSTPILQYVLFNAIQDPGSCTLQPFRNQVADRPGDFCFISANHPDWFLLDVNGGRISSDRYYIMDPGNAGWRAFWLDRVRQNQNELGWRGVFLDNVEGGLAEFRKSDPPAKYSDHASYQAAVEGFLQYLSQNYFQPEGRIAMANIISLEDSATWFRYLTYLDGAMDEGFAVDWWAGYQEPQLWLQEIERLEQAQKLGKTLILVAQGDRYNLARQQFALGSYLLANQGLAVFRYGHHSSYNQNWTYDNYALDLGAPLGPRYAQGSAWRRDFERGFIVVDPFNHTAVFQLK